MADPKKIREAFALMEQEQREEYLDHLRRSANAAVWPCLWPDCVGGPDSACYGKKEPCK